MKIITWNINGIRSRIFSRKTSAQNAKLTTVLPEPDSPIASLIQLDPDFIAFQETRCSKINGEKFKIPGYFSIFNESQSTGARDANRYSGTCIFYKEIWEPTSVQFQIPGYEDNEGRIIIMHFQNFTIINVYTPNSGTNFSNRLLWQKAFMNYLNNLQNTVYFIGDMNVAWRELDVHFKVPNSPTFTERVDENIVGFLKEEREFLTNLISLGFIDSYALCEDSFGMFDGFTYWDSRSRKIEGLPGARYNKYGWRIDYCLVKNTNVIMCKALYKIGTEYIHYGDTQCSDHCPVYGHFGTN